MKYMVISSLLLFSPLMLWASQAAVLLSDTPILESPSQTAEPISTIPKDAQVVLLKRKGGWYQVQTDANEIGWLRMLKVRFLSEQEANDKSIAKILRETAIMPPASGISVGVRGVSDEALNQQENNTPVVFDQLKNFVPAEESIIEFANQGQLKTQEDVIIPRK